MKKIFSLWLPLLILAGVIITVTLMGMNPKTTFGYELTTTPNWMIWAGFITLGLGSFVTALTCFDVINWGSDGAKFVAIIVTLAITVILSMLFFINFQYDFNNPYA